MENLIPKIIAWAEEINLILGSTIETETLKLVSNCGELTDCLDHKKPCEDAVGKCMLQMIIICKMQNISLEDCLKHTKTIKDERVTDPIMSTVLVFKTIGELAGKISEKKGIKAEVGYLLIYLTALTTSLNISIKECAAKIFKEVQEFKGIMFDGKFVGEADESYESAKSIINHRKSITE